MHEYEYKAVIDMTGFDMESYERFGLGEIGAFAKAYYENIFVHDYNRFCNLVDPKLPELNREWDRIKDMMSISYEQYIRKAYLKMINEDEWFSECQRAGLCKYEIDEQCQFILELLPANIRMRCHLEKI